MVGLSTQRGKLIWSKTDTSKTRQLLKMGRRPKEVLRALWMDWLATRCTRCRNMAGTRGSVRSIHMALVFLLLLLLFWRLSLGEQPALYAPAARTGHSLLALVDQTNKLCVVLSRRSISSALLRNAFDGLGRRIRTCALVQGCCLATCSQHRLQENVIMCAQNKGLVSH